MSPLSERNSLALMHPQQWQANDTNIHRTRPHSRDYFHFPFFCGFFSSFPFLLYSSFVEFNICHQTFLRLPFPPTPVFEVYFLNFFFSSSCISPAGAACALWTHRNVANETRYVQELEFGNGKTAHKHTNRNGQRKYVRKAKQFTKHRRNAPA